MSSLKLLLFIATSSFFILWINAQLVKYKNLSNGDFEELCTKNNVNLTATNNYLEFSKLFFAHLKADENPNKMQNCVNSTLRDKLQYNMNNIVKECVKGNIVLNESDIQQLIDESERTFCGIFRLAAYGKYLEGTGCLNDRITFRCEEKLLNMKLENINKFSNLGLSFTEEGLTNYVRLSDCTSDNVKQHCDKKQNEKREQLQKDFIDTFTVIRK